MQAAAAQGSCMLILLSMLERACVVLIVFQLLQLDTLLSGLSF